MLLLVSGATKTIIKYKHSPYIGQLVGPRKTNSIDNTVKTGLMWAADNDCYNGFNPSEYVALLEKISGRPRLIFVTAPDVVGDARQTLDYFYQWEPILKQHNLPIAFVGQDGIEKLPVPWERFDAFLLGELPSGN